MKFRSFQISVQRMLFGCAFVFASVVDAQTHDWQRSNAIPADVRLFDEPHVQSHALKPDQQPPLPATRKYLLQSYDDPVGSASTSACDLSGFAAATAAELPDLVRMTDVVCLNGLFYLSGAEGAAIVNEAKMTAVASALQGEATNYVGDNSSGIHQLMLFLRAGYYLQFFYPNDIAPYSPALVVALRPALDAFIANAHFHDINNEHGEVLAEFVILIDSSLQNAYALDAVRDILESYGPGHAAYDYMLAAVNQCFWVLYRGHQNADFAQLVQGTGSGIVDTLSAFIYANQADLDSPRAYLIKNAGAELARFLMYGGTFHSDLHPKVLAVLQDFPLGGAGGGLFARVGSVVEYYDPAHCAYFGTCNFHADLEAYVLPAANSIDCSPTLHVRSQALSAQQLQEVCDIASGEEAYFHARLETQQIPLTNDYNTTLEMVVFRSSTDYQDYSGILFGNSTNNGGIYLEGDAADPNNQARFLCFQAEWLEPLFEVWNLTHEYVHYLDGRFDTAGNFADLPMTAPYSVVWYVEVVAEYISYSYRDRVYDAALTEAADPNRFTLATLLDNEYADGATRVYRWGYLATRFMFEKHRPDIDEMLGFFRSFDYGPSGYEQFIDAVRTTYDGEFHDWLVCFSAHAGDTSACDRIFKGEFESPPECTASNPMELGNHCARSGLAATAGDPVNYSVSLYLWLPEGMSRLSFVVSGGVGNADIYVRKGAWPTDQLYDAASANSGNTETVTINNPVGNDYYYVVIKPNPSFSGVVVLSDWE